MTTDYMSTQTINTMSQPLANRFLLGSIVYEQQATFTADQIVVEYTKRKGDAIVDGLESIRGFLKSLEESGALKRDLKGYVVVR